ncbi:MAG: hypothetical protein ACRBK7_33230, partial [Acidimicrobiales bacterium]
MGVSSVQDECELVGRFHSVVDELSGAVVELDVSELGESGIQAVLGHTRGLQRRLDGLTMRLGVRANQLATHGASAPAAEAMRGGGTVGTGQARRESARAAASEQIDGLGEAASSGDTTGAHVDSIARHTAKLTEEQRAQFDFA